MTTPLETVARSSFYGADPIAFALDCEESVLAIITGIKGPSYRPLGEIMAFGHGQRVGSLSSGCIEADLAIHAQNARTDGPKTILYGEGSPFIDLQLPCGGGLEVTLLPHPDRHILNTIQEKKRQRQRCAFLINRDFGIENTEFGPTEDTQNGFRVSFLPQVRFIIFGSGPEASVFTDLVKSAHYPYELFAADDETLDYAKANGFRVSTLHWPAMPTDLSIDDRTATVLFFHDHSWEPTILARLLETNAFYIGAQGSRRAHQSRIQDLETLGIRTGLERIKGPIGLIPSARDARTLAVSVLADVLATVQ